MNDNERYMLTNQQQLTLTLESRADWGTALLKTEQVPWKCENFQAVKTCTELLSAPTQWSTIHQLSSSTGSAVYQSMHRAACRAAKPALRHKSGLTVVFLSVCWGLLNEVSLSPFWHVYPLIDLRSYGLRTYVRSYDVHITRHQEQRLHAWGKVWHFLSFSFLHACIQPQTSPDITNSACMHG